MIVVDWHVDLPGVGGRPGAAVEDAVEAMRSASGDPNFGCWWGADVCESWKQYVEEERVPV